MLTLEEAAKVAKIVAHADGGCPVCVGNLVNLLNEWFPEFVWTYDSKATEPEPDDDDAWEEWMDTKYECRVTVAPR